MAFDISYIGNLVQKFLAQEAEFQSRKAEREFYLRQIACHAQFMGDVQKVDEVTAGIIIGFIELFVKSNPQYVPKCHPLEQIDLTPRPTTSHFGGVRDD